MKILFTGGGTGGHILPIVAICREIRRNYPDPNLQFFYIGPRDDFDHILLDQEGIKVKHVLSGKIRRYLDWNAFYQNPLDILFKIPVGIIQAFFHIFFLSPDLIFSKGGFGSIQGAVAGWLLRVPVFLHESDIKPGLANRFLSKLAREVFASFPNTEHFSSKKIVLVGNPIRKEILEGSKEESQGLFNLTRKKPVILILGGSQGAQRINDKILENLSELLKNFEIIHQCGEKNFKEVKAESRAILPEELASSYHLFSFLKEEEIKHAYAACDIVVSRAGSGTIFEIAAVGKPSILIPLPESAQNHQLNNAYAYAESGAAIVLEENNFTSHFFLEKLKYLFSQNPEEIRERETLQPSEKLQKMQEAAGQFARPESAKIIASYLVEFLK